MWKSLSPSQRFLRECVDYCQMLGPGGAFYTMKGFAEDVLRQDLPKEENGQVFDYLIEYAFQQVLPLKVIASMCRGMVKLSPLSLRETENMAQRFESWGSMHNKFSSPLLLTYTPKPAKPDHDGLEAFLVGMF